MTEKKASDVDINVVTLNCWGIPAISKNRIERVNAIAKHIASSSYDIVCLQEVWSEDDYITIKDEAVECLPHSHFFFSGVMGSGLCVLSRFPIEEVFFHQWAVNGYVHKIQHGDWFGGKGVGLCRMSHGKYQINVYTAHLHAEYNRNCDMYRSHRVLQAFDTAQFIRLTSSGADLVVLGGDLNTEPGDLPYRIITLQAALRDSGESDERGTNESDRNSYSDPKAIKMNRSGKRIDYVLYKSGPSTSVSLVSYTLPLPERVPQCPFSYSDHEAVLSCLRIQNTPEKSNIEATSVDDERKLAITEGIAECDEAMSRLKKDRYTYYMCSIILFMVLVLICTMAEIFSYRFFDLLRLLVTIALCFTLFMATLWNLIERNVVRSAKLGMELAAAHDITK